MGKILPILLALIGLGAGVGAGIMLRPDTSTVAESSGGETSGHGEAAASSDHGETTTESADHGAAAAESSSGEHGESSSESSNFVKMANQMVVPVVHDGDVSALVVVSLSIEVTPGYSTDVYQLEPRLRNTFLQVLFDHSNSGGFDGAFTSGPKMKALHEALYEAAHMELGEKLKDVLITDIARQDL
jgi:flagellar protein FliL